MTEITELRFVPDKLESPVLVVPITSCRSCSNHTQNVMRRIQTHRKDVKIVVTGYSSLKEVRLIYQSLPYRDFKVEADTSGIFEKKIEEDPYSMWLLFKGHDGWDYKIALNNENYPYLISKLIHQPPALNYNEIDQNPTYEGGIQQFYRDISKEFLQIKNSFPNESWLHFDVDTAGSVTNISIDPPASIALTQEISEVLTSSGSWISGEDAGQKVTTAIKLPLKQDYLVN